MSLDFRNPRNHTEFTFSVFSNPLEIHRYFEQQMSEMAKHIEESFSRDPNFNSNGSALDSFFGKTPFYNADQVPAILPPSGDSQGSGSLRGKCLKPSARQHKRESAVDSDLDNE